MKRLIPVVGAIIAVGAIVWSLFVLADILRCGTPVDERGYRAEKRVNALLDGRKSGDSVPVERDVLADLATYSSQQRDDVFANWLMAGSVSVLCIIVSLVLLVSLKKHRTRGGTTPT